LVGLINKPNLEKDTLIFGGEIYTGWMTHWGERWGNNPF
jgi:beta-galactosidase